MLCNATKTAKKTRFVRVVSDLKRVPVCCGDQAGVLASHGSHKARWSTVMHGQFGWNELLTPDVEAAKRFYATLLGWEFVSMPMAEGGPYWVAMAAGQPVAGLMPVEGAGPGTLPQWFAYIEVDDTDARCASLEAGGGTVLRQPWDIAGVGRIAVVMDPQKVAFGLMTSIRR